MLEAAKQQLGSTQLLARAEVVLGHLGNWFQQSGMTQRPLVFTQPESLKAIRY